MWFCFFVFEFFSEGLYNQIWVLLVALPLQIVNHFMQMALQFMMMYQYAKFGYKRFSSLNVYFAEMFQILSGQILTELFLWP